MSVNLTRRLFILLVVLLAATWCPAQASGRSESAPGPDETQKRIAAEALGLVGRPNLVFTGRSFPSDCSGTVMAALYNAGIDVTEEYGSFDGNGVRRLDRIAVSHGLDYDLPLPELGDVIYWDNTFDKNGDLQWNDELTHTGIVVGVNADGTISYVHYDYRRGIVVAYMNLLYPQSRYGILPDGTKVEINSPLRMNSHRYLNLDQYLSSQLFRGFGRLHQLVNTPAPAATASRQ
jgi:hypothetical protein